MRAREIPFVDAHVHLWDLDAIAYGWLTPPFADDGPNGSVEPIATTYLPKDYRAESANWNVAGVVHVDAGADVAAALDETQWLQGLADSEGLPNAIVAFAALDDPGVDELLASHAKFHNVRGIRHIVNWHTDPKRSYTPRDVMSDEAWERGYAALAHHGLSFDLQCYPGQMPAFAQVAARHPEVAVSVNHLGMPVVTDPDGVDDWRRGMAALAALPQVSVKLSGLGFITRYWTPEDARPFVREAIDLFGPARLMMASDFPTDRLFADFDTCLDALDALTDDLSDDERRAMWGGNARAFYRLEHL